MSKRRYNYRRLTDEEASRLYGRKHWAQVLVTVIGYTTLGLLGYLMFMLIFMNIITGCGQAEDFADGTWQTGTCHPDGRVCNYEVTKGTWK